MIDANLAENSSHRDATARQRPTCPTCGISGGTSRVILIDGGWLCGACGWEEHAPLADYSPKVNMTTCPTHGTPLTAQGKCFWCEHPGVGEPPLLGGADVVFPPVALGGRCCSVCGGRMRLQPDGLLECFWCKYPSRNDALVAAEGAASHAMLLRRDAAWTKAIGDLIGWDAVNGGTVTPAHMALMVKWALPTAPSRTRYSPPDQCRGHAVFEPGVDDAQVKRNLEDAGIDMAPVYKRMHEMVRAKRCENALRLCLEALEKHDEWCGHNADAPGNGIINRAEKAARAALADE